MAWLRAFSLIALWGSSQSVGRLEWGLYFELIRGIYAVIQGLVMSSKQLDAQTCYDTACSTRENCCFQQTNHGKQYEIAFLISHLMSGYNTREPKPWRLKTEDVIPHQKSTTLTVSLCCTELTRCNREKKTYSCSQFNNLRPWICFCSLYFVNMDYLIHAINLILFLVCKCCFLLLSLHSFSKNIQ